MRLLPLLTVAALASGLVLAVSQAAALAQGSGASSTSAASPAGRPAASLPQSITVEVAGFRSARFGMTGDQVLAAIRRDFDVEAKDVRRLTNELQKTDIFAVEVDDLVPGSGRSVIFYLFGFASKKLIHVNVVWGQLAQQKVAPATLVNTGRILQQYFVGQGFDRSSQVVNQQAQGGQIVLFQGFDEKKRAVQLVLDMVAAAGEQAEKPTDTKQATAAATKPSPSDGGSDAGKSNAIQAVASSLRLSYIENVSNPDIYKVPKGKF